ncbi:MAG: imidazole glycerol phosphate synthase subunit HisH [Kiritimatiellaeota bacterium]|nr:imidazole glycerol phosphate synthase subunit HisH [Kiritimatiellota bacterium]
MGMIGIINIGLGNVDSVGRAIRHLGHDYVLCHEPRELEAVEKIIFPGVGSYGAAAKLLGETGFRDSLRIEVLDNRKPILGICLGMQLLADRGEEGGGGDGLGLIHGTVELHRGADCGVSIPHIGWNDVFDSGGVLYDGIPDGSAFYFVHSYEFIPASKLQYVGICDHGIDFTASIEDGHIFGTQFHPEKSQECGLSLLDNFIKYKRC